MLTQFTDVCMRHRASVSYLFEPDYGVLPIIKFAIQEAMRCTSIANASLSAHVLVGTLHNLINPAPFIGSPAGLILGLHPANERRRYTVTLAGRKLESALTYMCNSFCAAGHTWCTHSLSCGCRAVCGAWWFMTLFLWLVGLNIFVGIIYQICLITFIFGFGHTCQNR